MDSYDVKRLGLILSIQATIEGMKAANEERKSRDEALAYNEGDFQEKTQELENATYSHNEQLF